MINFAVNDDAAAYAGSQGIAYAVINSAARAAPCFSKRRYIRIVVYFDRLAKTLLQNGANRYILESYIRCQNNDAFTNVREACESGSHSGQLIPGVWRFLHNVTHIFFNVVNYRVNALCCFRRPLKLMQKMPFLVANSDFDCRSAQVDTDVDLLRHVTSHLFPSIIYRLLLLYPL